MSGDKETIRYLYNSGYIDIVIFILLKSKNGVLFKIKNFSEIFFCGLIFYKKTLIENYIDISKTVQIRSCLVFPYRQQYLKI